MTGRTPRGEQVVLRPLGPDDEAEFRAAHESMEAPSFAFGLRYEPGTPWGEHLASLEAFSRGDVPPGYVRSTFLVAEAGGKIVGRTSIRHELNDHLAREGGHIGVGILPAHRGHGFGSTVLRMSVEIARSLGIDRVLVTCADDNPESAAMIEACGGVLEGTVVSSRDGSLVRRHWIG